MADTAHHRTEPMHPAMRDRILRVSADLRLRCRALSGEQGPKLDHAIALLGNLTPAKSPQLDHAEHDMAEAAANVLRLAQKRLALWEAGELPTPAEASAMENDLIRCTKYLSTWLTLLEDRKRA